MEENQQVASMERRIAQMRSFQALNPHETSVLKGAISRLKLDARASFPLPLGRIWAIAKTLPPTCQAFFTEAAKAFCNYPAGQADYVVALPLNMYLGRDRHPVGQASEAAHFPFDLDSLAIAASVSGILVPDAAQLAAARTQTPNVTKITPEDSVQYVDVEIVGPSYSTFSLSEDDDL